MERINIIMSTGMVHAGTRDEDGGVMTRCGVYVPAGDVRATDRNATCGGCFAETTVSLDAYPTPARPTRVSDEEIAAIVLASVMRQRPDR